MASNNASTNSSSLCASTMNSQSTSRDEGGLRRHLHNFPAPRQPASFTQEQLPQWNTPLLISDSVALPRPIDYADRRGFLHALLEEALRIVDEDVIGDEAEEGGSTLSSTNQQGC